MHHGRPLDSGSEPGAVDPQSPLQISHGEALLQLHAACLLAVQHDPIDPRTPYSAAEYEIIQGAVARFVASCMTNDLPPERILMLLKRAVNESLRSLGREPEEMALRGIILEAFLHSYYGGAQSV